MCAHPVLHPRSPLQLGVNVRTTVLFRRMDKQTLGGDPFRAGVRVRQANHLHLAVDRPAEGASGHAEIHVGVDVLQPDRIRPYPAIAGAYHQPVITGIAFP